MGSGHLGRGAVRLRDGAIVAQFLKLSHQLARMWRSLVGPVSDDKNRAEQGNFGDHKFCRDGVWELRVDVGAGYRVYYGIAKRRIGRPCPNRPWRAAGSLPRRLMYFTYFSQQ